MLRLDIPFTARLADSNAPEVQLHRRAPEHAPASPRPFPEVNRSASPTAFDISSLAARRDQRRWRESRVDRAICSAASTPPTRTVARLAKTPGIGGRSVQSGQVQWRIAGVVKLTARIALGVLSVTRPKSIATGASVATGAVAVGAMPVPLRPTVCGLPAAVEVIVTAPVEAFALVGANVTLIVQARWRRVKRNNCAWPRTRRPSLQSS